MKDQFNLLIDGGNLGFYTSCEVTSIFLLDYNKQARNFFTIFIFEERYLSKSKLVNLTSKLISICDGYSLGIQQKQIPINDTQKIHDYLFDNCDVTSHDFGLGKLHFDKLKPRQKQFVPQDGTITIPLNNVLKNNFQNGSYIIEFFDSHKSIIQELSEKNIRRVTDVIFDIVPIDLHTISDRIGNIIFQFPSQAIFVDSHCETASDSMGRKSLVAEKMKFRIFFDNRIKTSHTYRLIVENENDNIIVGHSSSIINTSDFSIDGLDTNYLSSIKIVDEATGLIQHQNKVSPMMSMHMNMHLAVGQYRDVNGEKVQLVSKNEFCVGEKDISVENWLDKRKYKKRLAELERGLEFVQYAATNNADDRERAISDIHHLLQMYGDCQKIYLWDPYLTANDIIDTLFYHNIYNLEMYAITSGMDRKLHDETSLDLLTWIAKQNDILTSSDSTGIKMEFRCQHAHFGFPFHDRFLIFIKNDGSSLAWSLGTSVNALGRKHHIIQKAENSGYIVDAFENLWSQLSDEACLVWRK